MGDSDTVPPNMRPFTGKELTLKEEWHPLSGICLLWWALASSVSWVLGPFTFSVLVFRVSGFIETSMPTLVYRSDTGTSVLLMIIWGILVGVVFGITFGILQWLVLRKYISRASSWILDTLLGLCLGAPVAFVTTTGILPANPLLGIVIVYVLPGIIVGLVQQLTLRRHFSRTWWWLAPSAFSWPVIIVMYEWGSPIIFAILAGLGLAIGAISGVVFSVISRNPKQRVARETIRARADTILRSGLAVLLVALIIVAGIPLISRYSERQPFITTRGQTSGVASMSFSRSGALAAGYFDGTVRVWQVPDGELLGSFEHINKTAAGIPSEVGLPMSVAFSPDGKILASGLGGVEDTVKLWRVSDGALLQTINNAGNGVTFSPDGQTLASLELSAVITENPDRSRATRHYYTPVILQVADGKRLLTGERFELDAQGFLTSLVFSPDGKRFAAGFGNGDVRIWWVENMSLTHTFMMPVNMVGDDVVVAFSPDSKTLAAGTDRGTIQLWRVDDREIKHENSPYTVRGIAFSPDGDTLVSVSANSVHFWNVRGLQLVQTLYRDVKDQDEFAFSHDVKTLASGDKIDGTIRIFDITE